VNEKSIFLHYELKIKDKYKQGIGEAKEKQR